MGEKKEIRFTIDTTTPGNRQLIAALSKYRPHDRNKLILDVLISHFVTGGIAAGEEIITSRTEKGGKLSEIDQEIEQLKERVDKIEIFLFSSQSESVPARQAMRESQNTEAVMPEKHSKEEKASEEMPLQDQLQMNRQSSEETVENVAADIPEDVMNMIMALQNS